MRPPRGLFSGIVDNKLSSSMFDIGIVPALDPTERSPVVCPICWKECRWHSKYRMWSHVCLNSTPLHSGDGILWTENPFTWRQVNRVKQEQAGGTQGFPGEENITYLDEWKPPPPDPSPISA